MNEETRNGAFSEKSLPAPAPEAAPLSTAVPDTVPLNMVPLDKHALALLAEIDRDERDVAQQITGQRIGVIRMVMKQQRLEGIWGLSEDRRSIVRRQ